MHHIDRDMINIISDEMFASGLDPTLIENIADLSEDDDDALELMLKWYRFVDNRITFEMQIGEFLRQRDKI